MKELIEAYFSKEILVYELKAGTTPLRYAGYLSLANWVNEHLIPAIEECSEPDQTSS